MNLDNTIVVTGGAGFIGANFVLDWLTNEEGQVVNMDLLTYSGNYSNLSSVEDEPRHEFVHGDIRDQDLVGELLQKHRPRAVIHFAAESHVDRSIHGPEEFVQTNVVGTYRLLHSVLDYWRNLGLEEKADFRFLHVSTDEVYGSLDPDSPLFNETTPYSPNSPYSASKAASDHFVRVYHHTYGLPTLTTNCSNNYGRYQFPEKLIPLMITNALAGKPLPVYGDGLNIRDWIYVEDHCRALRRVLADGRVGETYNIGGGNEMANINIVKQICILLDELSPSSEGSYERLITFVKDRPGHDRRYAIDNSKIGKELGWKPQETFATGIRKTITWYLDNPKWIGQVTSGAYRHWIEQNYEHRN